MFTSFFSGVFVACLAGYNNIKARSLAHVFYVPDRETCNAQSRHYMVQPKLSGNVSSIAFLSFYLLTLSGAHTAHFGIDIAYANGV